MLERISKDNDLTYIYRADANGKNHIWNHAENDTYCRMWSTGGLKTEADWRKTQMKGHRGTCTMCKKMRAKHSE